MSDFDNGVLKKKRPPLPTHCDTPLTLNNARKALLTPAPGQYIRKNNPIRREYQEMQRQLFINSPNLFELSKIQGFLLSKLPIPHTELPSLEFHQALRISHSLFEAEVKTILNHLGTDSIDIPIDTLKCNQELKRLYMIKCFWEEAVIVSGSSSPKDGFWWKRKGGVFMMRLAGLDLMVGPNLFLVQTVNNTTLCSRDHLNLLSDLAAERFSVYFQSLVSEALGIIDCPSPAELVSLLDIGDEILTRAGNDGYDLVYTLEASCTSRFAGNYEGGTWETSKFRVEILKDMNDKAFKIQCVDLLAKREKLLNNLFDRNLNAFTQAYGLYRIWGHPTLDPLLGTIALKTLGKAGRYYLFKESSSISNKFKEDFILRYLNRHKEWPELDLTALPKYNIIRIHYDKKLEFPLKSRNYKRSHLTLVKFKQIFPIDPKFDLIEFIDDKSISLGFPELLEEITQRKNIGTALARSLLLKFLSSDISDPEEFLKKVDIEGFPPEEICTGVHEKEREGKLKARLFGLLTLVKRSYVVLTEKLIAEHVFPYYPEITMTDDELVLEKKRYNFTTCKNLKYMISLDFSKWNTNMRDMDTRPFYESLDQMFGFTNCFTRTHEMFFNSYLYLIDGSYLPTITNNGFEENIGCWKHHLGGIEGLRQKGWTLWTVVLIRLVAEDFRFNLRIMGQGDNQMLLLDFGTDIPEEIAIDQVNQFLENLKNKLNYIGPPLKIEETWVSRDFFLYGKYPIKNGVSLTTSWKKSCRMFRCCNEDYPTIESSLSSLAANLYAAVASDNYTQPLFFLYLFELVGLFQCNIRRPYLQKTPFYDSIKRTNQFQVSCHDNQFKRVKTPNIIRSPDQLQADELYISLCLCPRTLGGYPVVLYPSILVKGAPDQLSYDIATLMIIQKNQPQLYQRTIRRILNPYLSSNMNYSLLLMNPEAINLESTPTPSEARRTLMLEFLTSSDWVKQPYIVEFLKLIKDDTNQELEDYLMQPDVIHPRILSLFVQATPQYRAQQVVGRLQKTPTMAKMYLKEGTGDLYSVLERSELNHFKSVLRQACEGEGRVIRDAYLSAVDRASVLRNLGWKKIIEGVDNVPPHEMFKLEIISDGPTCKETTYQDLGFISVRLSSNETISLDSLSIGTTQPYRGSITKNKINSSSSKIQARTPSLLQRVLLVASLESWAFPPGSALSDLARGLVSSVTDMEYQLLTPEVEQISGSYQHRLRNERSDNGGVSPVLPNQGTKIQFNTVPLVCLSKGSKNKNVMFQGPMVMLGTVIGEGLLNNQIKYPGSKLLHIHIQNPDSMHDLNEDPIVYQHPNKPISLLRNPDSPYLFFKQELLMSYVRRLLKYQAMSAEHLTLIPAIDRFHSLMAYDSLHLLDPWSWTSGVDPRLVSNGVTINWALVADPVQYLINLSILLITSYFSPYKDLSPAIYLERVLAIVKSSPIVSWENLVNISFSDKFPIAVLRFLTILSPQTSEGLTNKQAAHMLKTFTIYIIQHIISAPNVIVPHIKSLAAPPSVSFTLHPFRVLEIMKWILKGQMIHHSHLLYLTREKLELKLLGSNHTYSHDFLTLGGNTLLSGISSESLDFLCKMEEIKTITKAIPPESFGVPIELRLSPIPSSSPLIQSMLVTDNLPFSISRLDSTIAPKMTGRDYQLYKYRPAPLPTSGAYKLASVLSLIQDTELVKCCTLADGTGGFARVLVLHQSVKYVFYNTGIVDDDYVIQLDPIQNIPDISDLPRSFQKKIKGMRELNDLPSDITSPGYSDIVVEVLGDNVDLITGDAESPSFYDPYNVFVLFKAYRNISIATQSKIGIFKIHSKSLTVIGKCVAILLTYYSSLVITRSPFSLRSNAEMYFVCIRQTNKTQIKALSLEILKEGWVTQNIKLRSDIQSQLSVELRSLIQCDDQVIKYCSNYSMDITRFLIPHITFPDLLFFLQNSYPWLKYEHFHHRDSSSTRTFIEYHNIIHTWIHSIHVKDAASHTQSKSRSMKNRFERSEIIDLIGSFLLLILLYLPEERWNSWIPVFLREGCLIWISTENNTWFFTPYLGPVPPPNKAYNMILYPVSYYFNHVGIQKTCRNVGLVQQFHPLLSENENLQMELIATKPSNRMKCKNKSLKGLFSTDYPSDWKYISHFPDYEIRQFERIIHSAPHPSLH